jgi:phosphoribosylanthranilate isomerase
VFVDVPPETVLQTARTADLTGVQLHGCEPPEVVDRLRREGLFVVKALFAERAPAFEDAPRYPASAFLVECGLGALPGGNAQDWDWARAGPLSERHPLILAGGLTPLNAAQAVRAACPDAVDVSSGVETAPGRKDIHKVRAFIRAATAAPCRRRVFA